MTHLYWTFSPALRWTQRTAQVTHWNTRSRLKLLPILNLARGNLINLTYSEGVFIWRCLQKSPESRGSSQLSCHVIGASMSTHFVVCDHWRPPSTQARIPFGEDENYQMAHHFSLGHRIWPSVKWGHRFRWKKLRIVSHSFEVLTQGYVSQNSSHMQTETSAVSRLLCPQLGVGNINELINHSLVKRKYLHVLTVFLCCIRCFSKRRHL